MTDILKELYFNYYEGAHGPTAEYREACKKESEYWDKLPLSEEELYELQRRQSDMVTASSIEWFREGFRLGASLMLELMD